MADWDIAAVPLVALPGVLYAGGRLRLHRRRIGWPVRRDAAFAGALVCVGAAVVSPIAAGDEQFPVHVVQHLLLGMAAPIGFALAAPITLALRCSPPPVRTLLVWVLSSSVVRRLSWAPVGAALSVGLMWPLYLTGLYHQSLDHPMLHDLIHAHMLLSGCLFAFAMIGPDPIRGRGSRWIRLATLFMALAVHDILGKYLYVHAAQLAGAHPDAGSAASWQLGAQWMWYGGDGLDVVLAVAFCAGWYAAAGRDLARERRRAQQRTPVR
jgi:putative membrane protein